MIDLNNLVTSLILSGVMAGASVLYNANSNIKVTQENTEAVKELTKQVTEIRIQNAARDEKFITREELKSELKEIRRGS